MVAARDDKDGAGAEHALAPSVCAKRAAPIFALTIWPHRSLPRKGFGLTLLFAAVMFALPAVVIVGQGGLWIMLPFMAGALGLLWYFIERNYRDGHATREIIRLWPDLMTVERHDPGGQYRDWQANPYWIRTEIQTTRTTEHYLTLTGGPRRIEVGAFLSPEERVALKADLDRALENIRNQRE